MIDEEAEYIEFDGNTDWLDNLYDGLHRLDMANFELVPMELKPDEDYWFIKGDGVGAVLFFMCL